MNSFNMHRYYPIGQEFEIDPVCEMNVDPKTPPFQVVHKGRTYYFCSEVCKHLFERVPDQYVRIEEDKV